MRNYVRGVHVDPYHDFLKKCRENFKQGTAVTVLYIIVGILLGFAISWYRSQYTTGGGFGFALLFGLMPVSYTHLFFFPNEPQSA